MKKNYFFINITIFLFIFTFMIISISTIYSANTYLPKYLGNLSLKQFLYYILGFFIIFLIIKIKNERIYKFINIFYFISIISLIILIIFGEPINGSKCWFIIPYIGSIQPSEFVKYILIIKLSVDIDCFFRNNKTIKQQILFILKELFIIFVPSVLTFLEPDTGAIFMYLFSSLIIFYIAPFNKKIKILIITLLLLILLLFLYLYFFKKDFIIKILGEHIFYRIQRIIDWKNKTGMQLENSLISIGSSGFIGHGYNKTPLYFPESGTDFIFAVYLSNFGLIGGFILLFIILFFDLYLFYYSIKIDLLLEKILIIGFLICIIYQQLQNISMTLGILPITGITLPFISYGGSSLLSNMIMMGLIINIINKYKYNKKIEIII